MRDIKRAEVRRRAGRKRVALRVETAADSALLFDGLTEDEAKIVEAEIEARLVQRSTS